MTRALVPHGLEWSLTTTGPGDAARLARLAASEGARLVVTLGGDGTAAEAAGALAGGPVVMAPMPGGNANVFARALGWPNATSQALPALAAALASGLIRETTLGRIHAGGRERIFTINAGVGLDAATVEWIETRPRTKRRLRQAGFVVGAAAATLQARRDPRLWVSADGAESTQAIAILAACGSPYTYLGSRALDLVPGASFDGRLAWVALAHVRPHELGALALRAARGRVLWRDGPALSGGLVAHELVVRAEREAPVQADGEMLGRHAQVHLGPGPMLRTLDPRDATALKSGGPQPT